MPTTATITQEAQAFATRAHAGQVHRDGKDAIEHPLRVSGRFGHDPELAAIALLHDVLEDCELDASDLTGAGFPFRVTMGVIAMTRFPGESWSAYIARVKANPDAVQVKIADIEDNMARADEKFRAKMAMYEATLMELRELSA